MSKWRRILLPFIPVYGLAVWGRNLLFDKGLLPSRSFSIPVIVIGNLSTGGTGKTPMAEFLLEKLTDLNPGFVSRGYGRKTRGARLITASDSARITGDEPAQIMQKFPSTPAAVAEKRVEGIELLLENNEPGVIVLDDAYQHRYVSGDVNILLTSWQEPWFRDCLLPAGNLRESRSGRERASVVVVTKCPAELHPAEADTFRKKLKMNDTPVFFSYISYADPINHLGETIPANGEKTDLLTGIARTESIVQEFNRRYNRGRHFKFPDHHHFSDAELSALEATNNDIITTEKDWIRLKDRVSAALFQRLYYWPIRMNIHFEKEQELLTEIRRRIADKK